MAVNDRMTTAAMNIAKNHVYTVCQQGQDTTLIKAGTKDEFGEMLSESTLTLKAHPVRFTPFDRKVLDSISWSEDMDILLYVSKKEVDDLSLILWDLKQYNQIRYDSIMYDIRYIDYYSSFGTDHLYIVIGGKL